MTLAGVESHPCAKNAQGWGTLPIVALYETEEKFRAAGKNIVSLRPNEFMENLFFSLETIIGQGSIYTSVPGSVKAPFVATQDIAEIAGGWPSHTHVLRITERI